MRSSQQQTSEPAVAGGSIIVETIKASSMPEGCTQSVKQSIQSIDKKSEERKKELIKVVAKRQVKRDSIPSDLAVLSMFDDGEKMFKKAKS